MATEQVKRVIKKLKTVGFDRSEFKVRVERIYIGMYKGKPLFEYGDANITIYASIERQIELAEAMVKEGLYVRLVKLTNGSFGVPFVADSSYQLEAGVFLIDLSKPNEDGFSSIKKVKQNG